jgi:hypothetical protein
VVHEGHDRRRKVYLDGREERFDGKGNVPPKALHETLKYRPSIVAERVKYVLLVFKWYTTESITAGQIAGRLNELGVSPVFGPLWHQSVVKHLLSNPIYIGRPTYNKQSNSRFMEFTGGQVKTAERKPARRHAESDRVRPDRDEFESMVAPEIFDKAQAKLAVTKTRAYRAPKTASLWLRGFVVCAKCGKPMRGLSGNPGNGLQPGYVCAEYGRWGTRAPSGCGHFRVLLAARQGALERATATLNQEGHSRQKAEVLKTVVDKIICHFRRVGKRATLDSIEVIPAEDAAIRPLTFPGSLLTDSCLGAFA